MYQPKQNTGEEPMTPPPSYETVVNEWSQQCRFVTPYLPTSPPYPVTLDHAQTFHRIPMPMPSMTASVPMPMPMTRRASMPVLMPSMPASVPMPMPVPSMSASMPMSVPGSRVTHESHINDDQPKESRSTSYGFAETFRTTHRSRYRSGTDYSCTVATRMSDVNIGSSARHPTTHVFQQEQITGDNGIRPAQAIMIAIVVCLILTALILLITKEIRPNLL